MATKTDTATPETISGDDQQLLAELDAAQTAAQQAEQAANEAYDELPAFLEWQAAAAARQQAQQALAAAGKLLATAGEVQGIERQVFDERRARFIAACKAERKAQQALVATPEWLNREIAILQTQVHGAAMSYLHERLAEQYVMTPRDSVAVATGRIHRNVRAPGEGQVSMREARRAGRALR